MTTTRQDHPRSAITEWPWETEDGEQRVFPFSTYPDEASVRAALTEMDGEDLEWDITRGEHEVHDHECFAVDGRLVYRDEESDTPDVLLDCPGGRLVDSWLVRQ